MPRYSTSVLEITEKTAKSFGKFIVVGSVPPSCVEGPQNRQKAYDTQEAALIAILTDPLIQATPDLIIQRADCSRLDRTAKLFAVEGQSLYTLAQMEEANAEDDEVMNWLGNAIVGDNFPGALSVQRIQ